MPSLLKDLRMGMFLTYPIRKKLVMNPVPDYIPFLFFPLFSVDDCAIIQRILLEHLPAAFLLSESGTTSC